MQVEVPVWYLESNMELSFLARICFMHTNFSYKVTSIATNNGNVTVNLDNKKV